MLIMLSQGLNYLLNICQTCNNQINYIRRIIFIVHLNRLTDFLIDFLGNNKDKNLIYGITKISFKIPLIPYLSGFSKIGGVEFGSDSIFISIPFIFELGLFNGMEIVVSKDDSVDI